MDHGLPIERSVREGLLEVAKKLDLPPLATNDSHYVTKDQAESHAALLCVQSGKTLDDPNRFKFDGDGYYLRGAAEMREYWDGEVPGAADNTLLIAERVESYEGVFAEVDRMPRFPLQPGQTEDDLLRAEVEKYTPERFPERPHRRVPRAHRAGAAGDLADGLPRLLPRRRRPRAVGQAAEDRGRARPRLGHRVAAGLHPADHRPRPHRAQPAVRALPQPRARQPARHRPRLRRASARRGAALHGRQVGRGERRPGHHVRHDQDQGRHQGRRARAARPAGLRHRRPHLQGAAAADHGEGHPALGHLRPRPRALRRGHRGAHARRDRPRGRPDHGHGARPGGAGAQRGRARLRGDPLRGAAARRHPALEARRRLGHHRLGLPVV